MPEDFSFSKHTRVVLWVLLGAFVALLIFIAGVSVGERHGEHPHGAPGAPFWPGGVALPEGFVTRGHGAVGTIASVTLPTLTLRERDGDTVVAHVASGTPIAGAAALAPGQFVIIIGDPAQSGNEDFVDARFVRVLPPPPGASSSAPAQ